MTRGNRIFWGMIVLSIAVHFFAGILSGFYDRRAFEPPEYAVEETEITMPVGFVEPTQEPTPVSTPEPTPKPTPVEEVLTASSPPPETPEIVETPEPTPTPTPTPTPKPTPSPTPARTPKPQSTPSRKAVPVKERGNSRRASSSGVKATTKPSYLRNPPPRYPDSAQRRGLEGTALLRAGISNKGRVQTLRVIRSSGHSILDQAALRAVRTWRFRPATSAGRPVQATVEVPVEFRLR